MLSRLNRLEELVINRFVALGLSELKQITKLAIVDATSVPNDIWSMTNLKGISFGHIEHS